MSKPVFPASIEITEVGLRDGIQNEATFVPTETKIRLLDALIDAGVRHFEATSFVSPRAVPQLKDAAEVLAGVKRHPGVILGRAGPQPQGHRACAWPPTSDEVAVFLSASESHNQKNLNRSVERSLEDVREAAGLVKGSGVMFKGAIATAFGCPFEGDVPARPDRA